MTGPRDPAIAWFHRVSDMAQSKQGLACPFEPLPDPKSCPELIACQRFPDT